MCQTRPQELIISADDPASGPDTVCDRTFVVKITMYQTINVYDVNGENMNGGDDASGPDTSCDTLVCDFNEFTQRNECQECSDDVSIQNFRKYFKTFG